MLYEMTIKIYNPKKPGQKAVGRYGCEFTYDKNTYGNGYYLNVHNDRFDESVDLRYDGTFNPDEKIAYLAKFAQMRWNGKNGAWKLCDLSINTIED